MQSLDGHLVLSPSDLNDYVECPHLTTLELEVTRGEYARPVLAENIDDITPILRHGRPTLRLLPWQRVSPGLRVAKPPAVWVIFTSVCPALRIHAPPTRLISVMGLWAGRTSRRTTRPTLSSRSNTTESPRIFRACIRLVSSFPLQPAGGDGG